MTKPKEAELNQESMGASINEAMEESAKMRQEPNPGGAGLDPWKHRSQGMVCRTCMFFVEKYRTSPALTDAPVGRCRRHAPTMQGYPAVFGHDWCGDHKRDENKV